MEEDNISSNGSATFCGFMENSEVTCTAQIRRSVGFGAIATGLVYISKVEASTGANTQGSGKFCVCHYITLHKLKTQMYLISLQQICLFESNS